MAKVTGLGGVFIYANDAQALAEWYAAHFGLTLQYNPLEDAFFASFDGQNGTGTTFAILRAQRPLEEHHREFVVNYKVDDLGALVEALRGQGVDVKRQQDFDYGRFAWLKDPEGNPIELYQPL
jgi:predicted enzyme related to lactoylglutathione lyase